MLPTRPSLIIHMHIRAIDGRGQGRDPIMLIRAGDVPTRLLLAGDAAGEDAGVLLVKTQSALGCALQPTL